MPRNEYKVTCDGETWYVDCSSTADKLMCSAYYVDKKNKKQLVAHYTGLDAYQRFCSAYPSLAGQLIILLLIKDNACNNLKKMMDIQA